MPKASAFEISLRPQAHRACGEPGRGVQDTATRQNMGCPSGHTAGLWHQLCSPLSAELRGGVQGAACTLGDPGEAAVSAEAHRGAWSTEELACAWAFLGGLVLNRNTNSRDFLL